MSVPSQGDVLADRYRLDDRIAVGGMGEVWRASDTVLGRTVAVKLLHGGRATQREFQTRFHHEARAMAVLRHPGIADVHDYGQIGDGSGAYIVMAFIDGQSLDKRIAEDGRLDAATTMSIVAQAARALDAAHTAGIVHRDVKPGNLIVEPDGTVVLVDFGVARSSSQAALTGTNDVVGTALYIAPEQVSKQTTGPATDIYALGAVAYHCVAGRPPFVDSNPIAVAVRHLNDDPPPLPADVPAPVRELIVTAMAKNPADRYPSAAAMAEAAEAAASSSAQTGPVGAAIAAGGLAAADSTPPVDGDATRRLAAATDPAGPAQRRSITPWVLLALAVGVLAAAIVVLFAAPGVVFRDPDPTATPTGSISTERSGETGTRAPGEPGRPAPGVTTAPGVQATSPGNGQASPETGATTPGTGGTTQPGGGTTTTTPAPRQTPTQPAPEATGSALEQSTEPITTGSGFGGDSTTVTVGSASPIPPRPSGAVSASASAGP